MKPSYIIGILAGAAAGLLLAIVFRPSIPMLGQPPIGTSFSALTATGNDFGFRQQFGQMLFVFPLICAGAGALAAHLLQRGGGSNV